MQLKQLKLAGFKSFVEPTVIPFPSQLVAVVGPNGCGKSNIIDAVRWVMGESSAKALRGESMTDVIFNGSSGRKSVGQASVELVFDNSMGRLTGQYASYQEIAVKRLVTRDGESMYFLNGARCRRRDISDIFLGTGAGARGYSIIGQDMISRLIEARPDDLRAYLEEAAGISKYKERRRETLQRIGHTRENLERVADIREELDKQLTRLERQAKAAERYTSLKQDERLYKAEILALKWNALTVEQAEIQKELQQLSLQYEQYQAKISSLLKEDIVLREQVQEVADNMQQRQAELYQLGTEIARLEESMQQQQRERQRLVADQQQVQADWQTAVAQLQQDKEALTFCEQSLETLLGSLQAMSEAFAAQQQQLLEKQQQERGWNTQWQQIQTVLNQAQREAQVEQVRLQHIEQRRQQTILRLEKLNDELAQSQNEALRDELSTLQTKHIRLSEQRADAAQNHQVSLSQGVSLRQQFTEVEQQLHRVQDQVQVLAMEHGVLQAAQNAAFQIANDAQVLPQWKDNARLAEVVTVDDKWLRACELVLGESLQAIVLDTLDNFWPALPSLQGSSAVFVTQALIRPNATSYPRLADKIAGIVPCWLSALADVFAADRLEEALAWLPSLTTEQSVITPDGYWFGAGWVKIAHFAEDQESTLSRQQALVKLSGSLAQAQDNLRAVQANRDQLHRLISENSAIQDELKQTLSLSEDELRVTETTINNKRQLLENVLSRAGALQEESEVLHELVETLVVEHLQAEHKHQAATRDSTEYELQQTRLQATKSEWGDALKSCQNEVDTLRTAVHQTELQTDREKSKAQQLHDRIGREQSRLNTWQERLEMLAEQSRMLEAPDSEDKASLEHKMHQHQQVEAVLTQRRQQAEELQSKINDLNRSGKQEEQNVKAVQEKIQQQQMHEQAQSIRANALVELLVELNAVPELVLAGMDTGVTLPQREQDFLDIEEKIKRLGAINLVAIEEYQTERERKQHLDEQYQDLTDALATLDSAIAKMDKETEFRLKETFDQINTSFQALFPRLFGGGRAMLTLTCDNLLEAGVLVMAQPPGKRNSSIHMLSGGEKAMTAVALVFAIFQLNPSPFCMLDEVDAPLDDLNVRRFCDMVKEMSPFVQFLFITHNKVTMELADHLIGVTMREPGVSRVVAVDVEQALSIAE